MKSKNKKHSSEKGISKDLISLSIDTSSLSPEEVAKIIRTDIYKEIGI